MKEDIARKILEVNEDDTLEKIKKKYREKIKKYHPDRFHDNKEMKNEMEEKTKKINQAYKMLAKKKL